MTSRTIQRILRINHAGEQGAIQIYSAQIRLVRSFLPGLAGDLSAFRAHEIQHRAAFREAMRTRGARPCRLMFLWSIGGWFLGAFTALAGRRGIMLCTASVERTVHRHLQDQETYLAGKDDSLRMLIAGIRTQEEEHLSFAVGKYNPVCIWARLADRVVAFATEALIWATTRGESLQLERDLRLGVR